MLYRFIKICFLLVLFSVVFVSCGKKWKETTKVGVSFVMTQNSTGMLTLTSGTMNIGEIDFSGNRKKGGDVSFLDVEPAPLLLNLRNGVAQSIDHYDIPQGEYTSINIVVKTVPQNTSPAISLSGIFTYTLTVADDDSDSVVESKNIPVLFELNAGQSFSMNATATNGGSEIVLISGTPATCEITLNPYYWLATITEKQFKNTDKYEVNGTETIVINETENEDLYALIVARINQNATAVFK